MRSMPVVSFNGGRSDLQLIKHYTAHNCGAKELPWLRHFPVYETPAPLMPAGASPQDVDDRDEMVSLLKKGSCYMSLHTQKLVSLGVCNYLPASGFSYAKYLTAYGGGGGGGGLACQGGNISFLMNMWKIWPSCMIPCHPMWPSTPPCMATTP